MLESEDVEAIQAAGAELEPTSHKIAEALYAKAEQEQADGGDGAGPDQAGDATAGPADDVVDADFEEVKPS